MGDETRARAAHPRREGKLRQKENQFLCLQLPSWFCAPGSARDPAAADVCTGCANMFVYAEGFGNAFYVSRAFARGRDETSHVS